MSEHMHSPLVSIFNSGLMLITPEMAAAMLQKNAGNRQIRPSVVAQYADQMKRGQWQVTHQPIATDSEGNLVDGQHRLSAIVSSGAAQWMQLVSYDRTATAMCLPVDCGVRRMPHDVLRISKAESQVASTLLRMHYIGKARSIPIDRINAVVMRHGEAITKVLEASRSKTKQRSSAAVRAAVALRCISSPERSQAILEQYAAFALMHVEGAWPSVASLYRQFDRELKRSVKDGQDRETDRLARTWLAFCYETRSRNIRGSWDADTIAEMRAAATKHGIVI